jgi:NAD(P)-dependent dehydrogenase (short-subunit alcohol dehydrogenase family)
MKTVLITGINKGIGKALSQKFLAEGFEVIGTIYDSEIADTNPKLTVIKLDLSSSESIAHCTDQIISSNKKIDILINNAGILCDENDTTVIVDKLRETLNTNLIGVIDFTEHLISSIEKGGHIINMSSTAGSLHKTERGESHLPYHYPAYKISKAGLNMYTATLALRLKNEVTVSSVHPGWVKTDIGGDKAEITPEQASESIYNFAISSPETGKFWFDGKRLEW